MFIKIFFCKYDILLYFMIYVFDGTVGLWIFCYNQLSVTKAFLFLQSFLIPTFHCI